MLPAITLISLILEGSFYKIKLWKLHLSRTYERVNNMNTKTLFLRRSTVAPSPCIWNYKQLPLNEITCMYINICNFFLRFWILINTLFLTEPSLLFRFRKTFNSKFKCLSDNEGPCYWLKMQVTMSKFCPYIQTRAKRIYKNMSCDCWQLT